MGCGEGAVVGGGLQSFFLKSFIPNIGPLLLAVYGQVHLEPLPLEGRRYQAERPRTWKEVEAKDDHILSGSE